MGSYWRARRAAAGGAFFGALGASAVAALEGMALNAIGFTALGPAAGSYAAGWMSSTALANGVGVPAGSLYATMQSAAAGGQAVLGAPFVIATSVVAGVVVITVVLSKGDGGDGNDAGGDGEDAGGDGNDAGGDGNDAGGDDPATKLSEEEAKTEPEQPENNELHD